MNPLRLAILVAFVGASFWVLAPLLNIGWMPPPGYVEDPYASIAKPINSPPPGYVVEPVHAGRRRLQTVDVRNETVVVTIAGIAWVLVPFVKLKA